MSRRELGSTRQRWLSRITDPARWRDALTRNLPLKALSLTLACGLWIFVNLGERDSEAAYQVRLELDAIPTGLVVTGPRVDSVDVRLVGPRTLLSAVERQDLEIALSLDGVRPGPAVFTVGVEGLNLPRGLRVVRINPAQVTVNLERVVRKSVPVQLRLEQQPSADFTIAATVLSPDRVTLSGPESVVRDIEFVRSDALDLTNASTGTIEQEIDLSVPGESTTADSDRIRVAIRIEDVVGARTLEAVPVALRNPEMGVVELRPTTVAVAVEGPQRLVRGLAQESVVAWITLAQAGSGSYEVEPEVRLPAGVRMVSLSPRLVAVSAVVRDESDLVGDEQ